MALTEYNKKRNFKKTSEPKGKKGNQDARLRYVIQKHAARRLHYDFRLELDGVLKSWAVPKGPSLDPHDKRLAVETEDHPLEYANFEGMIPKGEYGAGTVEIWDKGFWEPLKDPHQELKKGQLHFELKGQKLDGQWILIRTRRNGSKNQWLLMKKKDLTTKASLDKTTGLDQDTSSQIKKISPQLATLATIPPTTSDWIHEIKFDGYRTLCHIQDKTIKLFTRSHLDWTEKYKMFLPDLNKLPVKSAWFDGEIVCLDENGVSDFGFLQEALKGSDKKNMRYYLFDLMELNGEDLRDRPLLERKNLLRKIVQGLHSHLILYSEHFDESGKTVLEKCCKLGLEGIVSKLKTAPYVSTRDSQWRKIKCGQGQEFVIAGYTEPKNTREGFGSLILGAHTSDGKLKYAGRVGTGFNTSTARDLMTRFRKLKSPRSFFEGSFPKIPTAHWLKPQLVGAVHFSNWTRDGVLRHPAFKGLRLDKKAKDVIFEKAKFLEKGNALKKDAKKTKNEGNKVSSHVNASATFQVSNFDKILIPEKKVTKGEIAKYYENIQDYILPFIKNRPLALLRCPDGINKECFFQKKSVEAEGVFKTTIANSDNKESDKKENEVLYIDSAQGLASLCQAGVLEIHPWGSRISRLPDSLPDSLPDTLVFDLDPDPSVTLSDVRSAALELRDLLSELNLKSFLKLSGGKGYHVQLPVLPLYTWEQIKTFTHTVVSHMAQQNPQMYVTTMSKSKRRGKIFLDYLRNGYGSTAISAYSVRARKEASVALPIPWNWIHKVSPNEYDLREVPKLLKKRKDPWADYQNLKQKIKILENKS